MFGIDAAGWTAILLSIGWLVILEGLLSADNALVLAVMVRHLPRYQQKKALRYGIWGAFLFRLIAVIFASYLLAFWWLKVLGGVYLLYLAIHHFLAGDHDDPERRERAGAGFWMTVVNVEIADIAFSIDSILAAVAMSEKLPAHIENMTVGPWPLLGPVPLKLIIVYIGGVLGIIAMRMVAGVFLILLERFKGLAEGAYLLVAWIGVALVEGGMISAMHPAQGQPAAWVAALPGWVRSIQEIPEWLFWTIMILIFFGSMLYRPKDSGKPGVEEAKSSPPAGGSRNLVRGNGNPAVGKANGNPAAGAGR
jgi:YkoY family integral membrane protein